VHACVRVECVSPVIFGSMTNRKMCYDRKSVYQAVTNQSQGQGWGRKGEVVGGRVDWDEGEGELHTGHFQIPAGMVVRGGRRWSFLRGAFFLRQGLCR